MCGLSLVALANSLRPNSGNLELLGWWQLTTQFHMGTQGPLSLGASPPAQSSSWYQMQWEKGLSSPSCRSAGRPWMIFRVWCLLKEALPAQGETACPWPYSPKTPSFFGWLIVLSGDWKCWGKVYTKGCRGREGKGVRRVMLLFNP